MLSWKWLELPRTGFLIQKRCCSQVVLQLLFLLMKGPYCEPLLARRSNCCYVLTQSYNKQEGRHLKNLMVLISFIEYLLPPLKPQSSLFFMDRWCFFAFQLCLAARTSGENQSWSKTYTFFFLDWIIQLQGECCFLKSHPVHSIWQSNNFWAFSVPMLYKDYFLNRCMVQWPCMYLGRPTKQKSHCPGTKIVYRLDK